MSQESNHKNMFTDAPCMDYLPTLAEEWPHPRGNVGKYSLHGASGVAKFCFFQQYRSANGKLVFWGPVVWDSNRGTIK